jgi:hypothetical protein
MVTLADLVDAGDGAPSPPGRRFPASQSALLAVKQPIDPGTADAREPLDLAFGDACADRLREQLGDRLELLAVLFARRATAFAVLV